MRVRLIATLIALIAVFSGGCGTVCNLVGGIRHPESEPRVYGGVIRDYETIGQIVNSPQADSSHSFGAYAGKAAVFVVALPLLGVVDPILSFVGDTLTLPITIPLQNRRVEGDRGAVTLIPAKPEAEATPRIEQLPDVRSNPGKDAGSTAPGNALPSPSPRNDPLDPIGPGRYDLADSRRIPASRAAQPVERPFDRVRRYSRQQPS
jgi:hypothetical protein